MGKIFSSVKPEEFKGLLLTDEAKKAFEESCKDRDYQDRKFWFPDMHEESGPFPDFSKYIAGIDAYDKEAKSKSIFVSGTTAPKKVKCQKPGCGKILSAPTNHRCDLCYCYYQ